MEFGVWSSRPVYLPNENKKAEKLYSPNCKLSTLKRKLQTPYSKLAIIILYIGIATKESSFFFYYHAIIEGIWRFSLGVECGIWVTYFFLKEGFNVEMILFCFKRNKRERENRESREREKRRKEEKSDRFHELRVICRLLSYPWNLCFFSSSLLSSFVFSLFSSSLYLL